VLEVITFCFTVNLFENQAIMIQSEIWPCFFILNTFINPLYPLWA